MSLPNPTSLDLTNLVDVVVSISPLSAPRRGFDQLLIVGTTPGIISATERVRLYQSTAAMLSDGYKTTSPEYIAAEIVFAQNPSPNTIAIGYQDLTASPAETPLVAIEACRLVNFDWYVGICLAAATADHKLIALWAESVQPTTVYAFNTTDADVLAGTVSPANIGLYLQGLSYGRTFGTYATNQGGSPVAYPNNIYMACAAMGYAMGQNLGGLANSAFTLMFKNLVGMHTEPLSATQVNNITGLGPDATGVNLNAYLSYGNYYSMLQKGVMSSGVDFYETLGLDMLSNDIQLGVMDLLYGTPKIPQTDPGMTSIIHVINEACHLSVNRGFIAAGVWEGGNILGLKTGDPLPSGYLIQAQAVSTMTQAQRDAGKMPPIYIAAKLAGAVKYVLIQVNVNR